MTEAQCRVLDRFEKAGQPVPQDVIMIFMSAPPHVQMRYPNIQCAIRSGFIEPVRTSDRPPMGSTFPGSSVGTPGRIGGGAVASGLQGSQTMGGGVAGLSAVSAYQLRADGATRDVQQTASADRHCVLQNDVDDDGVTVFIGCPKTQVLFEEMNRSAMVESQHTTDGNVSYNAATGIPGQGYGGCCH